MNCADALVALWAEYGVRFAAGVPCSSLGQLIAAAEGHAGLTYVPAANEGDAVAVVTGAWLGGAAAGVVICQNSGLGNAVSPLTSLVAPIRSPLLLYVGWRGGPETPDEPQHALMGEITPGLLDLCGVGLVPCDGSPSGLITATRIGLERMARGERAAILVACDHLKGRSPTDNVARPRRAPATFWRRPDEGERAARVEVLAEIRRQVSEVTVVLTTTGKTSRELFALGDSANQFYQAGAMGCVGALGLGVAQSTDRPVVVVDGDGAALMRLGALSTIGALSPPNLVHVLLDNERHDSTGGQRTTSDTTDLAGVAAACGYPRIARCATGATVEPALRWALDGAGPTFLHIKIASGSLEQLGRPTIAPHAYARRFRDFLRATP